MKSTDIVMRDLIGKLNYCVEEKMKESDGDLGAQLSRVHHELIELEVMLMIGSTMEKKPESSGVGDFPIPMDPGPLFMDDMMHVKNLK